MSSIIRWSLICVTFAFVTLASCGDEQPTTAKPAMSVTPTSQPTAKMEPTLTPTIQPTAAATQTPQESIVKIGTTVEAGGSSYTVNEIIDPAPEGGFRAKDGNRLITIDVTQKAIDDEEPFNLLYFAAQDSDGFVYEPSLYSSAIMEPSMGSGELGSGQLVRGWVSFEIPDTATLISILVEPEVFGQRVTIVDFDPSSSPGNLVSSTTPPPPSQ